MNGSFAFHIGGRSAGFCPSLVTATVFAGVMLAIDAAPAQAYLGPGGAASAIGTLLALLAAMVMAVFGFLWFPIRRLRRRRRQARINNSTSSEVILSREQEHEEK